MKGRYALLDALRGLCVISMVLYHGLYDVVAIGGFPLSWYWQWPGHLWQQSICWTFILLSGFCWSLSRRPEKHGGVLVLCGALVSLVTYFVMPSQQIRWGILTLLGLSALLTWGLVRLEKGRFPPAAGLAVCCALFAVLRDVPQGFLGFESLHLVPLPQALYRSRWLAGIGLPGPGFFSSDYFPLVPWFFLYLAGFFLYRLLSPSPRVRAFLRGDTLPRLCRILKPLQLIGRRSLWIYLAHQPALMLVFWLVSLF